MPLVLSNRVLKDGAWVSMPDGFPKMETQGGSAIFIFRFPKFNDNAVYDPIIGMGETIKESLSNYECSNNTLSNGTAFAAGTTCRAAATICDVAEVCDGASLECPVDLFQPDTAVARPVAGLCDVQELCTGSNASIPSDVFKDQGTVCRAAVSLCDVKESCLGSSAACPVDGFAPSSTLIHASTSNDDCDPAEYCSGVDSTVPANVENCTRIAIDVKGQSGKFSVFDQTKGSGDPVSFRFALVRSNIPHARRRTAH